MLFAIQVNAQSICGAEIAGAKSTEEARQRAVASLSMAINSKISIDSKTEEIIDGFQSYLRDTTIQRISSELFNAHDAKYTDGKNKSGYSSKACMSASDAAKGFTARLRTVAASLEFAAKAVIGEKHPKLKSEAWQKTKQIWSEFVNLQFIIQGLDKKKAAPYDTVLYTKARSNYLNYCETAKLYWNPEKNNPYSDVAFSKLSKNLKLEKASCKGHGISLVYKNTGHECRHSAMFRCLHKPSLLIASCNGEEYRLLENPNVEVLKNVEEVALRELREKLSRESFWNEWEQEIKQWRPVCE